MSDSDELKDYWHWEIRWSEWCGALFILFALIEWAYVSSEMNRGGGYGGTVFQQIAHYMTIAKVIRPADWLIAGFLMFCAARLGRVVTLLSITARNQVAISPPIQRSEQWPPS